MVDKDFYAISYSISVNYVIIWAIISSSGHAQEKIHRVSDSLLLLRVKNSLFRNYSLKEGLRCTINAKLEFITMLASGAWAISSASSTNTGPSRSTWDAPVEFIAVVIGSALWVGSASGWFLVLGSRGTWNAPVELIAVVIGSALWVGSASSGLFVCGSWSTWDAPVELIAVVVSCALWIGSASGRFLIKDRSRDAINAKLELIAMLASGAWAISATLGTNGSLNWGGSSCNAEFELVAVVSSGAGAIRSAFVGGDVAEEEGNSQGDKLSHLFLLFLKLNYNIWFLILLNRIFI